MSKLLIEEEPLQVLPSLALEVGLDCAIFLQQLHYWLRKSRNEHDGERWVYNTLTEWQAQFPFWSPRTIQRIADQLTKRGLIKVRKLNKQNWDRTNWYTINYDAVNKLPVKKFIPAKIVDLAKERDQIATRRAQRR